MTSISNGGPATGQHELAGQDAKGINGPGGITPYSRDMHINQGRHLDPVAGQIQGRQARQPTRLRWIAGPAGQGAMHGHGLSRILDQCRGRQNSVAGQRVVGQTVDACAAVDLLPIMFDHLVNQHHSAGVR
ncbi:MAG: hypothetical protein LC637_01130 [Xanthomonadaceae bacterium]|nr:hypothetical protein [Xanthomonadaceae bacterium]